MRDYGGEVEGSSSAWRTPSRRRCLSEGGDAACWLGEVSEQLYNPGWGTGGDQWSSSDYGTSTHRGDCPVRRCRHHCSCSVRTLSGQLPEGQQRKTVRRLLRDTLCITARRTPPLPGLSEIVYFLKSPFPITIRQKTNRTYSVFYPVELRFKKLQTRPQLNNWIIKMLEFPPYVFLLLFWYEW